MGPLNWYWDKHDIENNTPSRKDGVDYLTEIKLRKEGSRFLLQCGIEMSLGYNTTATACVFFHRYYLIHSFKSFSHHYLTAVCSLYLAGKVEETPKRARDIVKKAQELLSEKDFASNFQEDPVEEIMSMERVLLQTLKFDLIVTHPYEFLPRYIKCLKLNKDVMQSICQAAWNLTNDSLTTTLSIQWEAEIVSIAVIHLAIKMRKLKVTSWSGKQPEHSSWWDLFVKDLSVKTLEDICHTILDLYSSGKDKQSNFFAEASKAIDTNSSSPPSTPPKQQKVETTSPLLNYSQPNATATAAASWPPMQGWHPPMGPPTFNVPPPIPPYPATNPAMPQINLSVPPPNLHFPPPMVNHGNYYRY